MAIAPIGTPVTAVAPISAPRSQGTDGPGFSDTLKQIVDKVETSSATANDAVGRMLDGTGDVHEAMIALQTSDLTLELAIQIRNKFVQAYQDIMRMPV